MTCSATSKVLTPIFLAALCGIGSTSVAAQTAIRHPTVDRIIACFATAVAPIASNYSVVLIGIDNQATGSQYQHGRPQAAFSHHALGVMQKLGFKPIWPSDQQYAQIRAAAIAGRFDNVLIINGGVTGFDAVTSQHREGRDLGLGFGDGRGSSSVTSGKEASVSIGAVSATVNVHSPVASGPLGWQFAVTASGQSTAEFRMDKKNKQFAGSLVLGFGGGTAEETVAIVDSQNAAIKAVDLALVMALAQRLRLNSDLCN